MCNDHAYEALPPELLARLEDIAQPIRCLAAIGVHEHCEHVRPAPMFGERIEPWEVPTFAQLGAVTS